MSRPYVVVDVETTGLDADRDHVWELAALRYNAEGLFETGVTTLVQHDVTRSTELPTKFREDHDARYAEASAWPRTVVASILLYLFRDAPTFVAATPSFDTRFVSKLLDGATPWHFRLRCVTSMASGALGYDVGGLDDALAALGLEANPAAHTAYADADAAARVYNHLMFGDR